jgi:hypothetical protein
MQKHSRRLLPLVALLLGLSPLAGLGAQEPTAEPTLPQPPPEVFNCVRLPLDRYTPELAADVSLNVGVDASGLTVVISGTFTDVTCYAVYVSGSGPPILEWDAAGVVASTHNLPLPPYAGVYCYDLRLGNPAGWADVPPTCIEITTDVAPPPPPTPTMAATPPPPGGGYPGVLPPDVGNAGATGSVSPKYGAWLFGGLFAVAGAALAVRARLRRSQSD